MKRKSLLLITGGYFLFAIAAVFWLDYKGWLHLDFMGLTPVSFYGKVVDEKGNPVPAALIDYSCDGRKQETIADQEGLFHVSGMGTSIYVSVSRPGYYHFQDSAGGFRYSSLGRGINGHPDPQHPAVLVLRKAGTPARLEVNSIGGALTGDGMPVELNLERGTHVDEGQGDVTLQLLSNEQSDQPNQRFDWGLRISIPSGGLAERSGDFNFEAPAAGYQPFIKIDMRQSLGSTWHSYIKKDYFVKLADGTYARFHIQMNAGGDNGFLIRSYWNPQPGSRNLEYRIEPDDF